jgi:WD40 repeat protein
MELAYKALKVARADSQQADAEAGTYFCHASGDKLVAGCSSFSFALCSAQPGCHCYSQPPDPSSSHSQIDEELHRALCYNSAAEQVLLPGQGDAAQATLLTRGGPASALALPGADARCYAFSPDGRWLMVGDSSGQVRLVGTSSSEAGAAQPQLLQPSGSCESAVTCCCFGPSSQYAAAGEQPPGEPATARQSCLATAPLLCG